MAESPELTLAEIITLPYGTKPTGAQPGWYSAGKSLAQHTKNLQDEVAILSPGGTPGWGAALDTRWELAETSSSATAYTATPSPSPGGADALYTGFHIRLYSINQANSGAATLDVGTTDGAVTIKKIVSGAKQDLAAGDLDPDLPADLFFDGTHFVYLNAPESVTDTDAFVEGAHKNLVVVNNSGTPNSSIDVDADTVVVQDGSGGVYETNSVNLTIAITSSGANGLDTGSEATSTWYSIWVIWNGSTVAGLLSTSATSPTMPGGYTHKARVGWIYNNGSGNFIRILQTGDIVLRTDVYTADTVLSNGAATSFTQVTVEAPSTARAALLMVRMDGGSANGGDLSYDGSTIILALGTGGSANFWFPLDASQQIYYKVDSASYNMDIYGRGWRDNL